MQFWPRKRTKHALARLRSWATENKVKPLGFIAYKAGMTQVMAVDNRPKSITKGETVALPVTILECPPMIVMGVAFYKNTADGLNKVKTVLAQKLDKNLGKKVVLPKKTGAKFDSVKEFDDLRLLVHSMPKKATSVGSKKPHVIEVALGGSKDDKVNFAKENLGKEILVNNVFEEGAVTDIHGITKGKGFQGTVKRFGVPIKQKKGEKTKRGIGNLGAWTPKRVDYRVPHSGGMGFHLRTEYNKPVLKIGDNAEEVNRKGGITKYGVVKNSFMLIHGSVSGPRKRAVMLTLPIRNDKGKARPLFEIKKVVN